MVRVLVMLPEGSVRRSFFTDEVTGRMAAMKNFTFCLNKTGAHYAQSEVAEVLRGFDGCIMGWGCPPIDDAVGAGKPLRFVGVTGGSVRGFLGEGVFDAGVTVVNSADVMAESVAEGAMTYMLCMLRRVPEYAGLMRAGGWRTEEFANRGLFRKTVGLVGLGRVGRYLIDYLRPFDDRFLIYDPYVAAPPAGNCRLASLDEVLSGADIVSVHAALTDETRRLIDARALKLLKDGALLVNTARGGVIDQRALEAELATGRISAALDVFDPEPPAADSPLRSMKNVLLMPHMAGPTMDMRAKMTLSVLGNMETYFDGGAPQNEVTKRQYKIMT